MQLSGTGSAKRSPTKRTRRGPPDPPPARRYHFDRFGSYLGYLDESGRYYDREGVCRGYVNREGLFYDVEGTCRGHIDVQGQMWDERGSYRGYFYPIPRK